MAVLLRDIIANGLCVVNVKRSESESESESESKNTGSTEAWVWMEITVPTDLMPYIDWNTTAWTRSETTSGNNTVVTLKRATLLPAGETTATAFTKVALPASLERMPESLVTSGTVEIVVNAYAIQSDAATTIDAAINAYGTNGEGGEGNEPAGNVTVSNAACGSSWCCWFARRLPSFQHLIPLWRILRQDPTTCTIPSA